MRLCVACKLHLRAPQVSVMLLRPLCHFEDITAECARKAEEVRYLMGAQIDSPQSQVVRGPEALLHVVQNAHHWLSI